MPVYAFIGYLVAAALLGAAGGILWATRRRVTIAQDAADVVSDAADRLANAARAEIVARDWWAAYMRMGSEPVEARLGAHGQAMVLAAFNGERAPAELGIRDGTPAAEAIAAINATQDAP